MSKYINGLLDLKKKNQNPAKGTAYIPFDLFFGTDHPLKKLREKRPSFNNTISNVSSFQDADEMRDVFTRWSQDNACTDIEDVHKFIKGNMVGLLARDFSERNTIMNSGIVMDKPWDKSKYEELCYTFKNEVKAVEYICGATPTCNFVGGQKTDTVTHKKNHTAKVDVCFNEVCDEDVSEFLELARMKAMAVCDAILCKFTEDFYAFMNEQLATGQIPKVNYSEALNKHMIADFLAELHRRMIEIPGRTARNYIALGNATTMKHFVASSIYDGNNPILNMNFNMSTGRSGSALQGAFDLVTLNDMPDNTLWIAERNALKLLRNSYVMYKMGDVNCGYDTTHTFLIKYGFSRSCQSFCNFFCIGFPAPTEICEGTLEGALCPEAAAAAGCRESLTFPGAKSNKVAESAQTTATPAATATGTPATETKATTANTATTATAEKSTVSTGVTAAPVSPAIQPVVATPTPAVTPAQ